MEWNPKPNPQLDARKLIRGVAASPAALMHFSWRTQTRAGHTYSYMRKKERQRNEMRIPSAIAPKNRASINTSKGRQQLPPLGVPIKMLSILGTVDIFLGGRTITTR